jgi:hypothetical protein
MCVLIDEMIPTNEKKTNKLTMTMGNQNCADDSCFRGFLNHLVGPDARFDLFRHFSVVGIDLPGCHADDSEADAAVFGDVSFVSLAEDIETVLVESGWMALGFFYWDLVFEMLLVGSLQLLSFWQRFSFLFDFWFEPCHSAPMGSCFGFGVGIGASILTLQAVRVFDWMIGLIGFFSFSFLFILVGTTPSPGVCQPIAIRFSNHQMTDWKPNTKNPETTKWNRGWIHVFVGCAWNIYLLSAYDVTIINSFPQLQSPVRYQGLVLLSPSGRPSTWLEAASFQPLLLALRTADPGAPLRTAPGTSLTGLVDTLVHYSRHYDAPDARRALLDELGARSAGSVLRLVRAAVGRPAIEGRGTEWGGRWLRAGALRPRVLLIAGEDGYYYDVGGAAWGLPGLAWIFRFSIFGFRICFVWIEWYRIWVAGW